MTIRTKRRLCVVFGWLSQLGMLCIVGGCERGWEPLGALWWAAALEIAGAAALWKAGWIRCWR